MHLGSCQTPALIADALACGQCFMEAEALREPPFIRRRGALLCPSQPLCTVATLPQCTARPNSTRLRRGVRCERSQNHTDSSTRFLLGADGVRAAFADSTTAWKCAGGFARRTVPCSRPSDLSNNTCLRLARVLPPVLQCWPGASHVHVLSGAAVRVDVRAAPHRSAMCATSRSAFESPLRTHVCERCALPPHKIGRRQTYACLLRPLGSDSRAALLAARL